MKVIIPIKLYQKLRHYVENTELEISGLGKVRSEYINGETIFYVEDIRIFKQKVSGANTVLNRTDLGKFFSDLLSKGEKMSDWKLWWHSHNRMGAFFSGIDTATIEEWDSEMDSHNYIISLVTNHKGDNLCRVDLFAPFRYEFDQVEFEVDLGDKEMKEEIIKEIKEKVRGDELFTSEDIKDVGRAIKKGLKDLFIGEEG